MQCVRLSVGGAVASYFELQPGSEVLTAQVGGINVHSIHHTKIKLPGTDNVSNVCSAVGGLC